ncbi:MAG: formylglycine-generating enzyme family protein [Polyangiaceae bacterium]
MSMCRARGKSVLAPLLCLLSLVAPPREAEGAGGEAAPRSMRRVGPGVYRPLYATTPAESAVPVAAFFLDTLLVTNRAFSLFLRSNPDWRRGNVPRIFADESYLAAWENDMEPGKSVHPDAPVVRVSWFSAKAYCAWRGARLPTEAEWELAAAASVRHADGSLEPQWRESIAAWYARPSPPTLSPVGRGTPNFWGIHDLNGLVWEWVLDFNSSLVASDAREAGDKDRMRFCGAGALGAKDKTDYVKFMRIAMRSSLRGDFTTANLGFRCAMNEPRKP